MLFERRIIKQKECAAVPDGDVIRVIERITIDNGRKGKNHWIVQKKRVSIVDRKTGKRVGNPIIEEKTLDKMPGFGEAIWEIRDNDAEVEVRSQIRDSVRKILKEQAAEKAKAKPTEEEEVVDAFHRTLKQAAESKSGEPKKPAEPEKAPAPEPKKESTSTSKAFSAMDPVNGSVPNVWW